MLPVAVYLVDISTVPQQRAFNKSVNPTTPVMGNVARGRAFYMVEGHTASFLVPLQKRFSRIP